LERRGCVRGLNFRLFIAWQAAKAEGLPSLGCSFSISQFPGTQALSPREQKKFFAFTIAQIKACLQKRLV
jgi:hypothetical protein